MRERLKAQWVLAEEGVVERTVGDANLTAGLGVAEYDGSLVQRLLRQVATRYIIYLLRPCPQRRYVLYYYGCCGKWRSPWLHLL